MISEQQRREECRREVRAFLVRRQKLAFCAESVHRRLKIENDFSLEEIEQALTLLAGLGQCTATPEELGATLFYQATSAGVLAEERAQ